MHGPSIGLATATLMGSGTRGRVFQDHLIRNQSYSGLRMRAVMAVGMSQPIPGNLWMVTIQNCEIHVVGTT